MTTILLSPADAGSSLAKEIAQLGARVIAWPEFEIDAPETYFALDEAIENLFGYDWLVLKNEIAADSFLRRFQSTHKLDELDALRTLVIGDSTADMLVSSHIHVDLEIDRLSSANVFAAMEGFAGELGGLTLLLPSAGLNCESFEQRLAEAGARVDNVAAYRTTSDNQRLAQLLAYLLGGGIDGVIFTNPTSLDDFRRLVDTDDLTQVLADVAVVCGDAETARAAHDFGLAATRLMPEPLAADALSNLIKRTPSG